MNPTEALAELARIPERTSAAACFGESATAADRTVIPVAEVSYGLAFGWGGGEDPNAGKGSGGGAGGGSRARGIAVIELSPGGVRIHPIVDHTSVTLAGLTFATAAITLTSRTLLKLVRG